MYQRDPQTPNARELFLGPALLVSPAPGDRVEISPVSRQFTETASHFAESMLRLFGPEVLPATLKLERELATYNADHIQDPVNLLKMIADDDYHPAQVFDYGAALNGVLREKGARQLDVEGVAALLSHENSYNRLAASIAATSIHAPEIVEAVSAWIPANDATVYQGPQRFWAYLGLSVLASMRESEAPVLHPEVRVILEGRLQSDSVSDQFKTALKNCLRSEGLTVESPEYMIVKHTSGDDPLIDMVYPYVIDEPLALELRPGLATDTADLMLEFFGIRALPAAAELLRMWPLEQASLRGKMLHDRDLLPENRMLTAVRFAPHATDDDCRQLLQDGLEPECFIALAILYQRPELGVEMLLDICRDPAAPLMNRCFAGVALGHCTRGDSVPGYGNPARDLNNADQADFWGAVYAGRFNGEPVQLFLNWYQQRKLPWSDFAAVLRNPENGAES